MEFRQINNPIKFKGKYFQLYPNHKSKIRVIKIRVTRRLLQTPEFSKLLPLLYLFAEKLTEGCPPTNKVNQEKEGNSIQKTRNSKQERSKRFYKIEFQGDAKIPSIQSVVEIQVQLEQRD